jgi:hypothetical protein
MKQISKQGSFLSVTWKKIYHHHLLENDNKVVSTYPVIFATNEEKSIGFVKIRVQTKLG